jgi:hypothetical protein
MDATASECGSASPLTRTRHCKATLCDLLDFERSAWLEGKFVLPVLQGKQQEINEAIFGEVTYHAADEPSDA